jgi:preprotein translocase subunit SecG
MYLFFSILIVLACVLLVCAVLIQKSKGAGLASNYADGNQFMGYRKTTDFIEKATWTLAIFICVLSILSTFVIKTPIATSSIKEAPAATSAPAAAEQPAAPNQLPTGK